MFRHLSQLGLWASWEKCTDALAHNWPRDLRKCVSLSELKRTCFLELMLLATAPPLRFPLRKDLLTQRQGDLVDAEVLGDLPQEVLNTITSARAPSIRTGLCFEVEPVHREVFFLRRRPAKILDQRRAFFPAARVRVKVSSLHHESICGCNIRLS